MGDINRFHDLLNVARRAANFGYWTYDYALAPDDPNARWGDAFYYSPENVAISGLTQEEVSQSTNQELAEKYVHPADRDTFIANLTAFAAGKIDRYQTEYVWFHPDGRELFIRSTGIRHRGPRGEPLQATGIVQDLTESRAAEQAIREQADALRRAELTLFQAQKGEALGNLAGGVAHDFQNVLAIIQGYVELSMRHVNYPDLLLRDLEKIKDSVSAGKATIGQILAFSRRAEHVTKVTDINKVIEGTIQLLQHSLPAAVEIRCEAVADDLYVNVDETLLQQAVINLCNNAAQAMPEGGVITVRLDRMRLAKPLSNLGAYVGPGDYVALYVADTGVGIPAELGSAIFDPFVTTKRSNQGTGLGLAIVQKTVAGFGGLIDFKSRIGKGTTFRILLPRMPAPAACPEGIGDDEHPAAMALSEARILIVDDEVALTESGGQLLADLGYAVTTSNDPIAALEMVRADPNAFDLIITDLKMAGMTGQKLISEVLSIRPDIRFIVVSGYGELRLADAATKRAVKSVLEKPVSIGVVARAVMDALKAQPAPSAVP